MCGHPAVLIRLLPSCLRGHCFRLFGLVSVYYKNTDSFLGFKKLSIDGIMLYDSLHLILKIDSADFVPEVDSGATFQHLVFDLMQFNL